MNTDNICYTGVGSIKSGNHTKKQFLNIMNKNSKKECSIYNKSLKCKSCKKLCDKENQIKNKDKIKDKQANYYQTNKDKLKLKSRPFSSLYFTGMSRNIPCFCMVSKS